MADECDEIEVGFLDLLRNYRRLVQELQSEIVGLRAVVAEYRAARGNLGTPEGAVTLDRTYDKVCKECGRAFKGSATQQYCRGCGTERAQAVNRAKTERHRRRIEARQDAPSPLHVVNGTDES